MSSTAQGGLNPEIADVLSVPRRYRTVTILSRKGSVSLEELARDLVEMGDTGDNIPGDLKNNHFPVLEEEGIVENSGGQIEYYGSSKLEEILDISNELDHMEPYELFDTIQNDRRRYTVAVLDEHGVLSRRELSETVSEMEGSGRRSVDSTFRQTHLPCLDEYNIIEYDNLRKEIDNLGPAFDEASFYIEEEVPETS